MAGIPSIDDSDDLIMMFARDCVVTGVVTGM